MSCLRKRPGIFAVLAALIALAGWRAVEASRFGPLPLRPAPETPLALADCRAVIHVHSHLSHDGRAGIPEIVEAARAAAVRVVYLTEHNNFGIASQGREGWHDGVLVLSGNEAGTCEHLDERGACAGSHMLVLGPSSLPGQREQMTAAELAALARPLGGLGFAAHPTNRKSPWRAGFEPIDGMEIVSFYTAFKSRGWGTVGLAIAAYMLNPRYGMLRVMGDQDAEIAYYDRVAASRPCVAIGGADAHANLEITDDWNLPLPSMRAFFESMTTHLLLDAPLEGDAAACKESVLDALRHGRAYVAFDALADPTGFSFWAEEGSDRVAALSAHPSTSLASSLRSGRTEREVLAMESPGPGLAMVERTEATGPVRHVLHPMGSIVAGEGPLLFRVRAPDYPGLTLTLKRDGLPVAVSSGAALDHEAREPGAYRCEATLSIRSPFLGARESRLWVLTNPIYLGTGWSGRR